jgi:acyl-CoA thioesterase YciA
MTKNDPIGDLSTRTLAMPADTNPDGDIFGGWVLSQMDIAGGIFSKKYCGGRTATVAVDSMQFHLPVYVGDVLCCYAHVVKEGNSSLTVKVEAWAIRQYSPERVKVTEGTFTFVAIDSSGRPTSIKKMQQKNKTTIR